jgi:rod shape-determining protein MreD
MSPIDRRPGIRPRLTFGRRLDIVARASFPTCITVLLMLLSDAPLGFLGQTALLPSVTVASVWFWSLARPNIMRPPAVFLIGILLDLLGYLPLGVGVFTLLAVHGAAVTLRRRLATRGFAVTWSAFTAIAFLAAILTWVLVMLLKVRLLSPEPAVFQACLTIAIYPALAIPFAAAHRSIANLDSI